MDRNQAVGLMLMAAILLGYMYFFSPTETPQTNKPKTEQTSISGTKTAATIEPDSATLALRRAAMGSFGSAATGEAKTLNLDNENLRITFNTKGGRIEEVLLKNYKTWDKKPLVLMDKESSKTDITFETRDGKRINLSDLYFEPSNVNNTTTSERAGKTVSFRASVGEGQFIEQTYTLLDKSFEVGYALNFEGLDQVVTDKPLVYNWVDKIKQVESDLKQNRNNSTINYYTVSGADDNLSASSTDPEAETFTEPVKWVSNKQNFFSAAIIAKNSFSGGTIKSSFTEADSTEVKTFASELHIPVKDVLTGNGQFTYYFGPNNYKILKKITDGFDENVELGWGIFAWVNKYLIIPVFSFLEEYISNYGIIIILLVLFIKTILFPLTYKSYLSMAKMKVLKPEIDAIKEKHDGDMQKSQAETMKLYSEMGVNPMSGCIPMLLQIPILFAMFNFFPNSIELRQEAFLWANDLSTYDVFAKLPFTIPFYGSHVSMFTILMTLSTILYTWSNNQMSTIQGPMKFYSYLMPFIFMFVVNSLPAGLSLYYFISNIVTFGQQALIRGFVDEKKIRARLEENKEKNKDKKPSSSQQRLQEAMKAATEKEAQQKKIKK